MVGQNSFIDSQGIVIFIFSLFEVMAAYCHLGLVICINLKALQLHIILIKFHHNLIYAILKILAF